jgi:hypothetical protein
MGDEMQNVVIITKAIADIFTVAGILFAVWKGLEEVRRLREQRQEELLVRKMEIARKLLDAMTTDPRAQTATQMIDWMSRPYEIAPGVRERIDWADISAALRIRSKTETVNDKEMFIRDCMDAFLMHIGGMGRALRRNLIEFEDLRDGIGYYVQRGRDEIGDALINYMKAYDMLDSLAVFELFLASGEGGPLPRPSTRLVLGPAGVRSANDRELPLQS